MTTKPRRTQANNKTQPTHKDVRRFIDQVDHKGRREDADVLLTMMQRVTGEAATLWGPSIVGFGRYHYVYDSGREGDHFLTGFAPRKANMVVYVMPGFSDYKRQLARLGKHKTGASCLYLGRLAGVDLSVLEDLVADSVAVMRERYQVT
ncbi:MAG: DUF1801 domain-containing protein [Pseudomonadota bacterium]